MVEGLLVADDGDQFAAKTTSLPSAFVAFSSDGGSLVAGLRIGEAIRRKGFSTIVPDGRRCASACALAWLGGVERFIGTGGRIGFHAGDDAASDRDTGIGNTVVSAYLAKIGLPYEAVIYITQTAPNEMTWLNMSDAAQRGIRVTLLSSLAKETVVAIPTRYGDVTVTRDDPGCCVINIRYGNQLAEIASTDQAYTSLEGVYKVKEGDLVVISSTSRARGSPPRHYVLLVDQEGMTDLTGPEFATSDGTFKATQRDGEVHFDLGSQKRKRKSAIYKNGTITVDIRSPQPEATLPKKECAAILNMVVKCVRLPECNEGRIFDSFAMAAQRGPAGWPRAIYAPDALPKRSCSMASPTRRHMKIEELHKQKRDQLWNTIDERLIGITWEEFKRKQGEESFQRRHGHGLVGRPAGPQLAGFGRLLVRAARAKDRAIPAPIGALHRDARR